MAKLLENTNAKPVLLLALAMSMLFAPFINKPLHIDDYMLLQLADMIGSNPLVANAKDFLYQGKIIHQLLPYESTHPLLIPYWIKLLKFAGGDSPLFLHAGFLVFPLIAILALYSINASLRIDRRVNAIITLLVIASPAFIVNAHNLMADVPTIAFILASFASYLRFFESDRNVFAYLGGVLLCVATFISYQSLLLSLPVFIYAFFDKKINRHLVASLFIAPFALGTWLALVYSKYDIFPFFKEKAAASISAEMVTGFKLQAIKDKLFYLLASIGLFTSVSLTIRSFAKKTLQSLTMYLIIGTAITYAFNDHYDGLGVASHVYLSLLMAFGTISLWVALKSCLNQARGLERKGQGLFFLAWIGIVIGYNLLLLPFGAARYLLPVLPAIVMLHLEDIAWDDPIRKRAAGILVLFAVAFGLATAVADYSYAGSYRTMSEEVALLHSQNRGQNFTVWYIGEWGMRYYFDRVGARYLLADSDEPKPGDFVITPEMPNFWPPAPTVQHRLRFFASRSFPSSLPIRLFNRRSGAGFYCHFWGPLPLAFSLEPEENFTIARVYR